MKVGKRNINKKRWKRDWGVNGRFKQKSRNAAIGFKDYTLDRLKEAARPSCLG